MITISCTGCDKEILVPDRRTKLCKECKVERSRARCRRYKRNNKEKIKAYNKTYKAKNKKVISEYNKKYHQENKEIIQKRQNKNHRNRRKNDLSYKIAGNMRTRIGKLLHTKKLTKNKKTLEILGCSLKMFKKWMKFQCYDGCKLKNYGEYWHMDHVIPCSLFNLEKEKDLDKCFHWTNIQPMKTIKNIKKNNTANLFEVVMQEIKIKGFLKKYGKKFKGKYNLMNFDKYKYVFKSHNYKKTLDTTIERNFNESKKAEVKDNLQPSS